MKEKDIRPKEIFDKYLQLSKVDGEKLDRNFFTNVNCPSCSSTEVKRSILKNNFTYIECNVCNSLYCNPRPSASQLNMLYTSSPSSDFWSKVFFPNVKESRIERMFKPKAKKILELISQKNLSIHTICDVGAGHGLLLNEINKLSSNFELFAIEPDRNSANICKSHGFQTLQKISEEAVEWKEKFDLVLSLEVLEHVFSPLDFIGSIYNLVRDDGYALLTGLGYEGYDILTLQDKSNSLFPPHHLNFLSILGFEELFKKAGFKSIEIWTPGVLDVDIVINSNISNPFLEAVTRRGENTVREFQKFLIANKLSSHVWILAKK